MQFLQHLGGRGSLNCFPAFMQRSDSVLWGASLPTWQVAMSCFPRRMSAKLRPPPEASPQGSLSFASTVLLASWLWSFVSQSFAPQLSAPQGRDPQSSVATSHSPAQAHQLIHYTAFTRIQTFELTRPSALDLARLGSLALAHSLPRTRFSLLVLDVAFSLFSFCCRAGV